MIKLLNAGVSYAFLQPMLAEYEDQGSKVDEVNDLGNALETLTSSGDRSLSPVRRMARKFVFFLFYFNLFMLHNPHP